MPSTVPRLSPRLITTQEAASLLRVTPRTIVNWIERGSIPYLELPSGGTRKEYRIPEVALLRSLSGNFDLEAELARGSHRDLQERDELPVAAATTRLGDVGSDRDRGATHLDRQPEVLVRRKPAR